MLLFLMKVVNKYYMHTAKVSVIKQKQTLPLNMHFLVCDFQRKIQNANRRDRLTVGPRSPVFTEQWLICCMQQTTNSPHVSSPLLPTHWNIFAQSHRPLSKYQTLMLHVQHGRMDWAEQWYKQPSLRRVQAICILSWTQQSVHSVTATTHMLVSVFTWSEACMSQYQSVPRLKQMQN